MLLAKSEEMEQYSIFEGSLKALQNINIYFYLILYLLNSVHWVTKKKKRHQKFTPVSFQALSDSEDKAMGGKEKEIQFSTMPKVLAFQKGFSQATQTLQVKVFGSSEVR